MSRGDCFRPIQILSCSFDLIVFDNFDRVSELRQSFWYACQISRAIPGALMAAIGDHPVASRWTSTVGGGHGRTARTTGHRSVSS
jgi:hypothetical protein